MNLFQQMQADANEAQETLAQMTGKPKAKKNFVGPNGQLYTLVFRPADAFESEVAAREMTTYGYTDRSIVVGSASRDQFDDPPLDWRRKNATRVYPQPSAECLIASVNTDDPLFYVFTLLLRQPRALGS